MKKLLAKKTVKHPQKHPLVGVISDNNLIPGIRCELHPGLTHRYSGIRSLIQLSLVSLEIKKTKKELRQIVEKFEQNNQNTDPEALKKRIEYCNLLIDIEIKMRIVDMITQRDILLEEFKSRHLRKKSNSSNKE